VTTVTASELKEHLGYAAGAMLDGTVVPVLGAGANLCDRSQDEPWTPGANLPNGQELAKWLADALGGNMAETADLLRVSQYYGMKLGVGPLYRQLHKLFDHDDYPIPTLHRFLAELPARMERQGLPRRHQLIVTTNYDNLLERALDGAGEPFDVVRYLATGTDRGRFVHERGGAPDDPKDRQPHVIDKPRKYDAVSPKLRTVVLKIHGGFDHDDADQDSYVITEDNYIDYLTHTSPNEFIPVTLLAKLLNSHFLFLGYSMRDWNLRVLLHRIWDTRARDWKSWAIQRDVDSIDEMMWESKGVELRAMLLGTYITQLSSRVDAEIDGLVAAEAPSRPK
jgi:SIR2-like domain